MIVETIWGNYEVLSEDNRHAYRRVNVNPGMRTEVRSYDDRDVFVVVEAGSGVATKNNDATYLERNKYMFVPKNTKYSLSCTSRLTLIFTEVIVINTI
jgi:mannose-6-phosphate isomerase-like protein (cupin superfamily)